MTIYYSVPKDSRFFAPRFGSLVPFLTILRQLSDRAPGESMPSATAERRSQRIPLDVPLVIKGRTGGKQDFREETFTLSASAHGVLLALKTSVSLGQKVQLLNRKTWDEVDGQVVYVGLPNAGLTRVGIEFERPAPDFWSLAAPPADWRSTTSDR